MGKRHEGKPSESALKSKAENESPSANAGNARKKNRSEPMPQIIARIPQKGMTRDGWDGWITIELIDLWFDRLPPDDLKVVEAQGSRWLKRPRWLKKMSPEALNALDEIIVRQAATVGWRIGLSWLVQWRLSEWEVLPNGLELLRRYHSSIARAVRIFRRLETPPLDDPGLYVFKVETIKELKIVLHKLRDDFHDRLCDPPAELKPKVVSRFLNVVKRNSRSLPYLASNRHRWLVFLNEQPTELTQLLNKRRLSPASLFDAWLAWCKHVSIEWLRQQISVLGSYRKIPTRITNLKL